MPARSPDPITFTLDVEDHRPDETAELRFPQVTRRVLDFLDEAGIRGTVFVVGSLAQDHADLVADIADRGHEVALHAWEHVPLTTQTPEQFRRGTARGKEVLEAACGTPVVGYRAPMFSLVPDSAWAPEILGELGFEYSSSVLPASNPLFGWPGAPSGPFRWPCGLVEIPAPVLGVGKWALPVLGGVYFRVLPLPVARLGLRHGRGVGTPWLYCHPYDFDPDEEFWVVPDSGRAGSRLLWWGRRRMFAKVSSLLGGRAGRPMAQEVAALDGLSTFDPSAPGIGRA